MSYICIFESQSHRSYKSFMFWRLSSKILPYKTNFVNSSLPALSLSLSGSNNFKHFRLSHWFDFLYRYIPLSCFFFTFLFDHIGEYLRISLLLSIHKISRYCSLFNFLYSAFCVLLLVLFDSFFHLYFLFKSLFVKNFSFDAF